MRKQHRALEILVAVVITSAAAVRADDKPAPDGCHWQDLPEIKAHLAVPDGWHFRRVQSENSLIFEVEPTGHGLPQPSRSRYRLEVRLHTDSRTVVERAREFVENARTGATAAQPLEEQTIGVVTVFSSFFEYDPAVPLAPRRTAAMSAIANSRTGTLYLVRFDIPVDELEAIAPLGNALFRTARIDDEM